MASINPMVRLLNLMNTFREEKKHIMGYDEEALLAYISEREGLGRCTTVSDLVASGYFGTAPTVQRRVNQLKGINLLFRSRCDSNVRKQCLHLSNDANNYMQDLSDYLSLG